MKSIVVFLFLYTAVSFSQEVILFKGTIRAKNKVVSDPVHMINTTQNIGVINNALGYFEIQARVGDTITFSSIQYQSKTYIIDQKALQNKDTRIHLKPAINQLEEVRLSLHGLSGKITDDIQKIPVYATKAIEIPEISFLTPQKIPLENLAMQDPIQDIPIDFVKLFDQVDQLFKKKRKSVEKKPLKILEVYSKDFFKNELQIPTTEVYLFLEYLENETVVAGGKDIQDPLKMLSFIVKQYKVFKAERGR